MTFTEILKEQHSSCLNMSSPNGLSASPHPGQCPSAGRCIRSSRARWSGRGLRQAHSLRCCACVGRGAVITSSVCRSPVAVQTVRSNVPAFRTYDRTAFDAISRSSAPDVRCRLHESCAGPAIQRLAARLHEPSPHSQAPAPSVRRCRRAGH